MNIKKLWHEYQNILAWIQKWTQNRSSHNILKFIRNFFDIHATIFLYLCHNIFIYMPMKNIIYWMDYISILSNNNLFYIILNMDYILIHFNYNLYYILYWMDYISIHSNNNFNNIFDIIWYFHQTIFWYFHQTYKYYNKSNY